MTDNAPVYRDIPDILIVDDTPANLKLLSGMLKEQRCKIRAAVSGEMALEAALNEPPDLILLDINMPGLDGYETCRRMKGDARLKDIPVIFLSALSETADKIKAFGVGGVDYITKPFRIEEVRARVETHLTLKAAREYLKEKNQFLEYSFSRFVSPKVLEELKKRPVGEFLKMERREVTILFADLRGFTSLSVQVPPEELQETINSALEAMAGRVEEFDGMIDKFLGDGLMAIFGAPLRQEDHAWRALKAAAAMQRDHGQWMGKRAAQGKPSRPLGVGLAAGSVVVGNYGTPSRMEYTALGYAVNLASRLCGSAEGGEILTTLFTRDKALRGAPADSTLLFSSLSKGKTLFKNIQEPVEVISITAEETSDE